MTLPAFITFTGLDEWVDLDRVAALSVKYPIEWGVLFSPKLQGDHPRYPSVARIEEFKATKLSLAAHLCGGYAKDVVAAGSSATDGLLRARFQRVQINTTEPDVDPRAIGRYASRLNPSVRAILQTRDQVKFPRVVDVNWLFDRSAGLGVLQTEWPMAHSDGPLCGYAGGLGPETIGAAMVAIKQQASPRQPYWIDMETAIRSDDKLDLEKCEAVCRAVFDTE